VEGSGRGLVWAAWGWLRNTIGKIVPVLHQVSTMPWRHMGRWRHGSIIVDLDTNWSWVVSYTPRPLYLRGKWPRYPLDRRLDGPQNRPGRCGEEKNLALPKNQTRVLQPVALRYTEWTILTTLLQCQNFAGLRGVAGTWNLSNTTQDPPDSDSG
jgi:hypothetical protein